jgi:hypothetical protein
VKKKIFFQVPAGREGKGKGKPVLEGRHPYQRGLGETGELRSKRLQHFCYSFSLVLLRPRW